MRENRLLDRIRMWNEQGHSRGNFNEDPGKIIASIINHLEKLLNLRQGTTLKDVVIESILNSSGEMSFRR